MVSPWAMRGKGVGRADRPVVPRPRYPLDKLDDLGGRAVQDGSMVLASWQAGASIRRAPNATSVTDELPVLRCDPLEDDFELTPVNFDPWDLGDQADLGAFDVSRRGR
jgi:hypothetical protein